MDSVKMAGRIYAVTISSIEKYYYSKEHTKGRFSTKQGLWPEQGSHCSTYYCMIFGSNCMAGRQRDFTVKGETAGWQGGQGCLSGQLC